MPRHQFLTSRVFFLLCLGALTGCSTSQTPITPEMREHFGKVYLHSAAATSKTYFHADFDKGGMGGALKGAGSGVLNGLDACLDSALGAGPLAPLVLVVCTPLEIPAGVVQGSRAGSQPAVAATTLEQMEAQTNHSLQSADLSGALVATIDEQSQTLPVLSHYDITHGVLPTPEKNQTISSVAAQWGYQTVLDIDVTKAGLNSDDGRVPMMHFSMAATVKIIDTAHNAVTQTREFHYDGKPQPLQYWFRDDRRLLADEIVKGNRNIARQILDSIFIK